MNSLMVFHAIRGAYWGIGLLLVWLAGARLFNAAHWALFERGWWPLEPGRRWPPINAPRPLLVEIAGLALGLAALAAFTVPMAAGVFEGCSGKVSPGLSALALHFGVVTELYFVARLAIRPRAKLALCLAWCLFMLLVSWVQG